MTGAAVVLGRHGRVGAWLVPAAAAVLVFLAVSAVLEHGVDHPDGFGPPRVFAAVMNAAALLRVAVMLGSPVVVWPWARARGATVGQALLAALAAPAAYVVWSVVLGLRFYPPAESLYYGTNPLAVASFAGSLGWCALMEYLWRRRQRRHDPTAPPARARLLLGFALGQLVVYLTVFWDGGIHWFYVWVQGYAGLFG